MMHLTITISSAAQDRRQYPHDDAQFLSPATLRLWVRINNLHCNPRSFVNSRVLLSVSPNDVALCLYGAVHKVRHARGGEGVREGVTVCDRGRGSRACDVTLIKFFIIHMKHEISSDV